MLKVAGADPGPLTARRAVLELAGVSKRFGPVQALTDVTLELREGEVLALVGENGAGKSTLLRILAGAQQPDAGELRANGEALRLRSPRDGQALGIRVIAQEPELLPDVSVAENLFLGDLPRRGRFVDRGELRRRATALVRDLGFEAEIDPAVRAGSLGTAKRQLVEILKALRGSPRVIAFDEPTSSLTEEEAVRLFAIVRRLRAAGTAIVYVSHRLREVSDLADRVAVLRDGHLVAERDAAGIGRAEMVRLMVGREVAADLSRRRAPVGLASPVALEAVGLRNEQLHDISLQVRAGEVLGVAGLIGAGRSELLETLFGARRLQAGEIRVAGRAVRLRSPADAIAAGIGFAPEDRKAKALVLARSVLENITLASLEDHRRGRFLRRRHERAVGAELAARLSVKAASLDVAVSSLSGGNQQKVVLARQLARAPRVLLLDEPTRGIDVGAKAEIYGLIDALLVEGVAVVLVSSELPEVLSLSHRVLVMAQGRLQGELPAAQATEEAVLALAIPAEPDPPADRPTTTATEE